jgi:hypothetical protein
MHRSSVALSTTVSFYYPPFRAQILMKCQREIVAVFCYDPLLYATALQRHSEAAISMNMHDLNLISSAKTATCIYIKHDTKTVCSNWCCYLEVRHERFWQRWKIWYQLAHLPWQWLLLSYPLHNFWRVPFIGPINGGSGCFSLHIYTLNDDNKLTTKSNIRPVILFSRNNCICFLLTKWQTILWIY